MTSKQLLQLAVRALNEIPNRKGIPGLGGELFPPPFSDVFSTYDLAHAIDLHLKSQAGFCVILGYPDGMCEIAGETYSSVSQAATWKEAVKDVAQQMCEDNQVFDHDTILSIVDVQELGENQTAPGVDLNAVVRFRKSGPVILSWQKSDTEDLYILALSRAVETMEMCPDLEPRSALKQAAIDLGIPYGGQMGAFVDWAENESTMWLDTKSTPSASKAAAKARRVVMGESTGNPDRFRKGERVEP